MCVPAVSCHLENFIIKLRVAAKEASRERERKKAREREKARAREMLLASFAR